MVLAELIVTIWESSAHDLNLHARLDFMVFAELIVFNFIALAALIFTIWEYSAHDLNLLANFLSSGPWSTTPTSFTIV